MAYSSWQSAGFSDDEGHPLEYRERDDGRVFLLRRAGQTHDYPHWTVKYSKNGDIENIHFSDPHNDGYRWGSKEIRDAYPNLVSLAISVARSL
ncbi:hypothetical protein [Planktothricoides raciborskii]|uniref:Uncharacterized protein n=2 Tax=Planktothricoides raciborskii TaxID=132608 RepID=A0AAU8JHY4_9CYAN|nr:hypothetical protein [Planktothricoides raciborskii]MBD2546152.1 hypothetical protein [Planktothricoides raciborskii FACHB-1370]MBD2583850.1 hypothetical protein [Planktothricoides raciborskii FACHB-1261]